MKVKNNPETEFQLAEASRRINGFPVNKIGCIIVAGGMCRDLMDDGDDVALLAPELDQYLTGSRH